MRGSGDGLGVRVAGGRRRCATHVVATGLDKEGDGRRDDAVMGEGGDLAVVANGGWGERENATGVGRRATDGDGTDRRRDDIPTVAQKAGLDVAL